jgi:hypothetical protein
MPRGRSRPRTGGAGRRDSAGRRSAGRRAAPERTARAERAREIAHLRDAEGLSFREIASRLGLAISTAQIYYADPNGDRQRRRREDYRGTCRSCGRQTSGAQGRRNAPAYCADCSRRRRRTWTEQDVLAAVRDWYALTGTPPTVPDWSPAHAPAGHEGAKRYRTEPGRWPSAALVARRLGGRRSPRGTRPSAPRPAKALDRGANRRRHEELDEDDWRGAHPHSVVALRPRSPGRKHRLPGHGTVAGGPRQSRRAEQSPLEEVGAPDEKPTVELTPRRQPLGGDRCGQRVSDSRPPALASEAGGGASSARSVAAAPRPRQQRRRRPGRCSLRRGGAPSPLVPGGGPDRAIICHGGPSAR